MGEFKKGVTIRRNLAFHPFHFLPPIAGDFIEIEQEIRGCTLSFD